MAHIRSIRYPALERYLKVMNNPSGTPQFIKIVYQFFKSHLRDSTIHILTSHWDAKTINTYPNSLTLYTSGKISSNLNFRISQIDSIKLFRKDHFETQEKLNQTFTKKQNLER